MYATGRKHLTKIYMPTSENTCDSEKSTFKKFIINYEIGDFAVLFFFYFRIMSHFSQLFSLLLTQLNSSLF